MRRAHSKRRFAKVNTLRFRGVVHTAVCDLCHPAGVQKQDRAALEVPATRLPNGMNACAKHLAEMDRAGRMNDLRRDKERLRRKQNRERREMGLPPIPRASFMT